MTAIRSFNSSELGDFVSEVKSWSTADQKFKTEAFRTLSYLLVRQLVRENWIREDKQLILSLYDRIVNLEGRVHDHGLFQEIIQTSNRAELEIILEQHPDLIRRLEANGYSVLSNLKSFKDGLGREDLLMKLIEAGARVNGLDSLTGQPLILRAMRENLTDKASQLFNIDDPVLDLKNVDRKRSILIDVVKSGKGGGFINTLIARKDIDVNAQDAYGQTALMIAVENDNLNTIHYLLQAKDIDLTLRNNLGLTAYDIATAKNQIERGALKPKLVPMLWSRAKQAFKWSARKLQ